MEAAVKIINEMDVILRFDKNGYTNPLGPDQNSPKNIPSPTKFLQFFTHRRHEKKKRKKNIAIIGRPSNSAGYRLHRIANRERATPFREGLRGNGERRK